MLWYWESIVKPLLDAAEPSLIVEVGSGTGENTENLLGWAGAHRAVVHAIDPAPEFDAVALAELHQDTLVFHRELSLNALPKIPEPDFVLIDGDHNWFTVVNELRLLAKRGGGGFPLTLLHDVGWPYGRRDLYYDPETIPLAHRLPHGRGGLIPGSSDLHADTGLNRHLTNAIYENDLQNGVLTAIEDFLQESHLQLEFHSLPGAHGLGVLVPPAVARLEQVRALLDGLSSAAFLRDHCSRLEQDRIVTLIASADVERRLVVRERDLARAEDEGQEATRRLAEAETERADLDEKLDALSADLIAAHAERDALRAQVADRELTITDLRSDHSAIEGRLADAEAARAELRDAQASLSRERESLAGELRTTAWRLLIAEADGMEREARASELQTALEDLRVRHDALTVECQALSAAVQSAEAERGTSREAAEAAATRAGGLQRELAASHSQLLHARQAIAELVGEIGRAGSDVERAAASRSWRVGHKLMKILSLLAFRRTGGTDALERAADRLRTVQREGLHRSLEGRAIRAHASAAEPQRARDELAPGEAMAAELARLEQDERREDRERSSSVLSALPELGVTDPGVAGELATAAATASVRLSEDVLARDLATAGTIVGAFRSRLHRRWLDDAGEANRRHRRDVARSPSPSEVAVVVGTLDSGEAELERSRRSVAIQDHPRVEHVVIAGLPKKLAIATLMQRFLDGRADFMVKVDADTVLLDETYISRAVGLLVANPDTDLLQVAILDYFSGGPMQGINVYRQGLDWEPDRQDALFTDRTFVSPRRRAVVWAPLLRSAIHSPDPTPFQAFHFGAHRALKVSQPDRAELDTGQAFEQLTYLERTWDHFCKRRDVRLGLAALGAEMALAGVYSIDDLDYTQPGMRESFSEFEHLSAGQVGALVESRRTQRVSNPRTERLRNARRHVHWQSSAAIRSVLILLPHFGVFGGVNRQFELAEHLTRLGARASITRPEGPATAVDPSSHGRPEYPDVEVLPFADAMRRSWDVVLCADCTGGVMLTMPLFRALRTVVYLFNGWMYRTGNAEQVRLVEPDLVIANSSYSARYYADFAPVTIPGAIDLDVFRPPAEATAAVRDGRLRVLAYPGRRKPVKGFDHVVAACRILHASGVPVELHVYDQSDFDLDVDFPFHHHGPLTREGVRDLLHEMDLFIAAEEDAGWSNPAVEAMACGVPVICTEAGTTDFAFDGETAIVVPFQDPDAIASAARRLWNEPEAGDAMRDRALAQVRDFDWPRVARRILDACADVPAHPWRRRALDRRAIDRITAL
jgi:predicted  nucleic acid-binding Zn-ribbon protein